MDHHTNLIDSSSVHPETTSSNTTMESGAPNSNIKVAAGYALQERLGVGSFATVYKGIRLSEYQRAVNTGLQQSPPQVHSIAAIKAISRASKKMTKKVLENLDMEISILRTYRHPNIVCLHDVQKTDRHFYLVLEYCGGGDLQMLIRTRQKGRLSERLCRRLLRDLTAGLGFLWGKNLVHRDIKPQNLLLTGSLPVEDELDDPSKEEAKGVLRHMTGETFIMKIADFGFARHLSGVDLAETMCGSPLYMAPEILSGEKYDAKADLWSVGAVLFEMIAGKTPFHGENHLDLLRNIKTKAVRLPANVRISKEYVKLLKLLLDRKPHNRADFRAFFGASEACVALGCNGSPAFQSALNVQASAADTSDAIRPGLTSGQQIVDRGVCAQMNLCAISENEGATGESFNQGDYSGAASLATIATLGTVNQQQLQQFRMLPSAQMPNVAGVNYISSMTTSQTNTLNAPAQTRPDHLDNNPIPTSQSPPVVPSGQHGDVRQQITVFPTLQGSPVLPSSLAPSVTKSPLLSPGGAPDHVIAYPPPRPGSVQTPSCGYGAYPTLHQQQTIGHQTQVNNQNLAQFRRNSSPRASSSHESSDSEFVMVEHSGCRSKPSSGHNSPSASVGGIAHSSSVPQHNSSGRISILTQRNIGILGTSPRTGRALVGKMISGSGKCNFSPRSAQRSETCLPHIEALIRMLATAEDIGRRAITVAHLGDVRAYMAMELLIAQTQREESQLSSMSTGTPMEGVDEEGNIDSVTERNSKEITSTKKTVKEDEQDSLPFDMTTSFDGKTAPVSGSNKKSENESPKEAVNSPMIQVHFREALMCYVKTLTMMKGSICAAQNVMKEVEDVTNISSGPASSNNPYTPLKVRCSASLEWLRGQFSAVLERADAANEQISTLQKANPSQQEVSICVEELIYNHSLKCGREGAVKQILGRYDVARSCYRSAGLLAETLLMESRVAEDDRAVLEGYIHSFADQILELDHLIRIETRKSRSSIVHGQESMP